MILPPAQMAAGGASRRARLERLSRATEPHHIQPDIRQDAFACFRQAGNTVASATALNDADQLARKRSRPLQKVPDISLS